MTFHIEYYSQGKIIKPTKSKSYPIDDYLTLRIFEDNVCVFIQLGTEKMNVTPHLNKGKVAKHEKLLNE